MIRHITIVVLLIGLLQPAMAGQIDYIIQFNNGAERAADASTSSHRSIEDGVPLPDHSMMIEVTRISTGNPVPGTFVLISLPSELPALNGHAKLYLELDRDKCKRAVVGCVVQSHAGGGGLLQDIQFSPVYMGASYPFGALP